MTKKEFVTLTGENPEDLFGPDWKNQMEELAEVDGNWNLVSEPGYRSFN